ncbi:hypothetical protein G9A89_003521 [Geosiphon pyriformis]|nr:hypothetical protein G9A89_003521 [Geosiphon pyriformis]
MGLRRRRRHSIKATEKGMESESSKNEQEDPELLLGEAIEFLQDHGCYDTLRSLVAQEVIEPPPKPRWEHIFFVEKVLMIIAPEQTWKAFHAEIIEWYATKTGRRSTLNSRARLTNINRTKIQKETITSPDINNPTQSQQHSFKEPFLKFLINFQSRDELMVFSICFISSFMAYAFVCFVTEHQLLFS